MYPRAAFPRHICYKQLFQFRMLPSLVYSLKKPLTTMTKMYIQVFVILHF